MSRQTKFYITNKISLQFLLNLLSSSAHNEVTGTQAPSGNEAGSRFVTVQLTIPHKFS